MAVAVGGAAWSGTPATGSGERPVIVATMSIWADIVDRVDCADRFEVRTLIPNGGDPHAYEPSMQDRDVMADAALVVANGADLEAQLRDTLDSVAGDGTVVFEVADHVTTRPVAAHNAEDPGDAEDAGEHGGDDPHVWFDPTLVIDALPALGDALVGAGADDGETGACVAALTDELTALDEEIVDIVRTIPESDRLLVTNHDSLGYFADHYGFEVIGSVLPSSSTLVAASPSELDELGDRIDDAGVPAIFAEALESTDDASALADRLGVEVVTLYTDSLGDADSGVTTYADLMRFDANAIAAALSADQ